MSWWMPPFIFGVWAFSLWQSWRGFKIGKVRSRSGDFDRQSDPLFFWPMLAIYLGLTVFAPIEIATIVVTRGLPPFH